MRSASKLSNSRFAVAAATVFATMLLKQRVPRQTLSPSIGGVRTYPHVSIKRDPFFSCPPIYRGKNPFSACARSGSASRIRIDVIRRPLRADTMHHSSQPPRRPFIQFTWWIRDEGPHRGVPEQIGLTLLAIRILRAYPMPKDALK